MNEIAKFHSQIKISRTVGGCLYQHASARKHICAKLIGSNYPTVLSKQFCKNNLIS
jgi:hypothetical protein